MKQFAALFMSLDQTTRTNTKVAALAAYFGEAPEADRVWAVALLSGRRPRRAVTSTLLRRWAAEESALPLWLIEETYAVVGDLAETIALVLPESRDAAGGTLSDWMSFVIGLGQVDEGERRRRVVAAWRKLAARERFVLNKLMTGGFRMGVSQRLMTRALSAATGIDQAALAHRLMGIWDPRTTTFEELLREPAAGAATSRPYPFYLAFPLEAEPDRLGASAEWLAERKWDGIRAQIVVRGGAQNVWSRGEELMTDRFPEFAPLTDFIADGTVIDGEILPWREGRPLPFRALQTRIGRKNVSRKVLAEAPVIMMAYDLLEREHADLRDAPLRARREQLAALIAGLPGHLPLHLSPEVDFESWPRLAAERQRSRDVKSEGLMLKRWDSPYRVGRRKGDWWKWKIDPLTIDAVLVYAEPGSGRRANLFTDYTFAVWGDDGQLVPVTKAYSGLTDAEFREVTAWVRRNTVERFGPVRRVTPSHVFEIAFEGIRESPRHKSGLALRFPRMSRWRRDKPVGEADTLCGMRSLLRTASGG